jgi:hypothetical protein
MGPLKGYGLLPPHLAGIEFVYALLVIAFCLIIYFKTKELYELTNHKGIQYFRNAFLFFALAYATRFLTMFFRVSMENLRGTRTLFQFGFLFFTYASSMALLYLLYSMLWRKSTTKFPVEYLLHGMGLLVPLIIFFVKGKFIFLITQIFILVFAILILVTFMNKKKGKLYSTYLFLFIFWIVNVLAMSLPRFMLSIKILIYLSSVGIFFIILHKVLEKTK